MVPIWLHAFSVWYFISLAFTIKWSWSVSVISGVLIGYSLLPDFLMHISVYFYWDSNGREVDPMVINYLFLPAFVAGISYLCFLFVFNTNTSVLTKFLLPLSFIVVTIIFTPAKDALKDIYWHSNHSVLHFITGFVPWMCNLYLKDSY